METIDFSTDMRRIQLWARRMGVVLHETKQLTEPYAWCQNHLDAMANRLVEFHGFRHMELPDNRMLFALVCDPYAWRVGGVPTLTPPRRTIELPIHATSFFSPERRKQWEKVFHSPLWHSLGNNNVPGSNTVRDLLNLLQCLLPGMFLIVEVYDGWSIQRGIPPLHWVRENKEILVSSIGPDRCQALCEAASDGNRAVIDSRKVTTGDPV